ncbi:MAG: LysR substrate-binding domain-containing protein [Phormidesmis sp.]
MLLRNRRGAVLTPIGTQIYQQAKSILGQLDDIQQTAKQAKGLQTGRVRVAAVRTVATHILPDVISQFRQVHPQMTVEITEYDRYFDVERSLRDGQADLGFTLLPAPAGLQSWELFREEFVALLPPEPSSSTEGALQPRSLKAAEPQNAQADDPLLTWEQLTSYSRIVNVRSNQHNVLVEQHAAKFGHALPAAYEVREDSTLMNMIKKGLGAAVLARLEAEPIPACE